MYKVFIQKEVVDFTAGVNGDVFTLIHVFFVSVLCNSTPHQVLCRVGIKEEQTSVFVCFFLFFHHFLPPHWPSSLPGCRQVGGEREAGVKFNSSWGWRTFQQVLLPDRPTCHRFQEVLGVRSCPPCLILQTHLDLLENHHDRLWQFQVLLEDLQGAIKSSLGYRKHGNETQYNYCFQYFTPLMSVVVIGLNRSEDSSK